MRLATLISSAPGSHGRRRPKRGPTARICRAGLYGFLVLTPLAAHAQAGDRVVAVAAGDPDMTAAIRQGQTGLPVFFGHLSSPGPDEDGFSVKYDLRHDSAAPEFIWAAVVSHRDGLTVARLSNVPNDDRFAIGQQVTVRDAEIIDWCYRRDGVVQGAFTTRALLKSLTGDYAAQIRAEMGWD